MTALRTVSAHPQVLGPVYHVFGDFAEDRDSLTTEARALNLNMSGQLWWRFLEFLWWPYLFGTFVHSDVPWSEKVALACRLWTTCRYCLDWDFTLKVVNLFPGSMSMLRDKDFLRNIEQWMRHAHQGNMWVERFFALVRTASPDKRSSAERIVARGALSLWMRERVNSGGINGWKYSRDELLKQGCPLYGQQSWERQQRRQSDPSMRQARQQVNVVYAKNKITKENRRRKSPGWPFGASATPTKCDICVEPGRRAR